MDNSQAVDIPPAETENPVLPAETERETQGRADETLEKLEAKEEKVDETQGEAMAVEDTQEKQVDIILIPNDMLQDERSPTRMSFRESQAQRKSLQTATTKITLLSKHNGKYEEIPNLLDGFRILNRAPAEDPSQVYSLDITGQELMFVVEDDLLLFDKLQTLKASENALPFARIGVLPDLRKLIMSCNGITSLDLDVHGKFMNLEYLDISYNSVDHSAIILLGTLPKLRWLDLTNNNIKTLPNCLMDMKHWQDIVIELLLPMHVAALDTVLQELDNNYKQGEDSDNSSGHIPSDTSEKGQDPKKKQMKGTGFKELHVLILEGNKLGVSGSLNYWNILSCFNNLTILNLNGNRISSVKKLIPNQYENLDAKRILQLDPKTLVKYHGFNALKELHLAKNNICTLDDLIGILFLRSLNSVFLESNPVMRQYKLPGSTVMTPKKSASNLLKEDVNIFKVFPETYNIKIADPCFNTAKVHLDESFVSIRPLAHGGGLLRPLKTREAVQKYYLQKPKQKPPMKAPLAHKVIAVQDTVLQERKERRKYQYTEEDIMNIIQSGKIPHAKHLKRQKPQEKEVVESAFDQIADATEPLLSIDNILEEDEIEKMEINYDRDQKDQTFMTGVHITMNEDEVSWSEISDDDFDEEMRQYPLPSNIQASVRALRHAIHHPVSYWRVMENSYMKPTQATLNRKEEEFEIKDTVSLLSTNTVRDLEKAPTEPQSIGVPTPLNSVWTPAEPVESDQPVFNISLSKAYAPTGTVSYRKHQQLRDDELQRRKLKNYQNAPEVMIKGSKNMQQLKKIEALQRARLEGRFRNADAFEEMNELIASVETKVNAVEVNLAKVLKSSKLREHLPTSEILLNDLQKEYTRIAALYVSDAEKIVKNEPLSMRLKKLGIEGADKI